MANKKAATKEFSIEDKLKALYQLQIIDSEIDKIRTVRGELPLEVQDLEDDLTDAVAAIIVSTDNNTASKLFLYSDTKLCVSFNFSLGQLDNFTDLFP